MKQVAILQKSAGRPPVGPPLPVVGVTGVDEDKTNWNIDRFLHLTFDLAVRQDSLETRGGVRMLKHAQISGLCLFSFTRFLFCQNFEEAYSHPFFALLLIGIYECHTVEKLTERHE